ncbi:MAG: Xaa-Pro dipeptidase [Pseudomonadota bacterium]
MTTLTSLYAEHLSSRLDIIEQALAATGGSALLVASGTTRTAFLDDKTYPFEINPHFKALVPLTNITNSYLLIRPGSRPIMFFHQPDDYWHMPPAEPVGDWTSHWDIRAIKSADDVHNQLGDTRQVCFLGEDITLADRWGLMKANPVALLARLHYERAYKTSYEIACMVEASRLAARGHHAAKDAFDAGEAEYGIAAAYLQAIQMREQDMPYSSIVALNEHCAVLHYQFYDRQPPPEIRSLLIDAGAQYNGYAADVTRTYARSSGVFADLVNRMDQEQLAIIDDITPGMNYADLHERMHHRLARVLKETGIVDMEPAAMVSTGVTFAFLPHGLGHLLGLQTHDVAGFQQSPAGDERAAPTAYPALRLTRTIEDRQVFTIEPGLYFIPLLLRELRAKAEGKHVNWALVETLAPYGGIRIEDNILVDAGHTINLTRDAMRFISDA